jgi:hypothetical protein
MLDAGADYKHQWGVSSPVCFLFRSGSLVKNFRIVSGQSSMRKEDAYMQQALVRCQHRSLGQV